MRAERRPRFYGWYIASCCLVVFFFTNGLSLYVPQNLFPRFMETFDATPAEVSRTTAISFALAGVIAPFVGAAIDRLGVVRVIRTGLMVLFAVLCGFAVHFIGNLAQVMGDSGQLPVSVAIWAPPTAAICLALAMLLHYEDG